MKHYIYLISTVLFGRVLHCVSTGNCRTWQPCRTGARVMRDSDMELIRPACPATQRHETVLIFINSEARFKDNF